MKKELSINIDSVMTSYSYYAFPQCIITAKERIGSLIAAFSILDSKASNKEVKNQLTWNSKGCITSGDHEESWEVVSEDKYRRGCNGCIYRKLENSDYLCIQVDFQQYTEPWSAINLFISDKEEELLLGDIEYLCRFGHFNYDGLNLYCSGERQDIKKEKLEVPYELVLSRTGNHVEVYAGEKKPKLVATKQLDLSGDRDLFIGVQVKHVDNSVFPWFYSNFIQLSCDMTNLDRRLQFHYGLLKHWDCNLFHYFLDINSVDGEMVLKLGGMRFIKELISRGKYLETKLDQYYVCGRDEYKTYHHLHQNLIYGYDDKNFLIVGYDRIGKLMKAKIRTTDFIQSVKKNINELIKIITYSQDGYRFSFDASYVKRMIEQYLDGKDSSEMFKHIVPQVQRTYGINIYEELNSDKGIKNLISDRRIAHILWEHKMCMAERIEYLASRGVLYEKQGEVLQEKMKEIADKVFDLKNILLKYQIRPDKQNDVLIQRYLMEICEEEKKCLRELLKNWKDV